jgi:hypothetical protein
MIARMDANHEKRKARMDAWLTDIKNDRKEAMACLEKTEARLEIEDKPASVDTTSEVAHEQEVPREDAEVMPVGEPRKRRRHRHLAAVRSQKKQDQNLAAQRSQKKQQKRTQNKEGCRKELVAARRGTTRRAQVARSSALLTEEMSREFRGSRKRLVTARRGTTRRAVVARRRILFTETTRIRLIVDVGKVSRRATAARCRRDATNEERDDTRRAPGERMPGKRRRVNLEGNTAMKDPGVKWQLHLRNEKTAGRIALKSHGKTRLEIARQIAGSLVGLHYMEHWTLWRGRPLPKRKK